MESKGGCPDWGFARSLIEMTDLGGEIARASREAILAAVCRHLEADLLYTVMRSEDGWTKIGIGPDGEKGREQMGRPTGIVRHVLSKRSRFLQERLAGRGAFNRHRDGWPGIETSSFLAVPIHSHGHVIGALVLLRGPDSPPFGLDDIPKSELVADTLAIRFDLEEKISGLETLASVDGLTLLPNYRTACDVLRREMRKADQLGEPLAIIMVDIDDLRSFNRISGYLAGSELLRRVGAVIAQSIRGNDHVARFGGDEFLVTLPQTGREGAECAAERIRAAVAEELLQTPTIPAGTCSCAVACYPEDGADYVGLINGVAQAVEQHLIAPIALHKDRSDEGLAAA